MPSVADGDPLEAFVGTQLDAILDSQRSVEVFDRLTTIAAVLELGGRELREVLRISTYRFTVDDGVAPLSVSEAQGQVRSALERKFGRRFSAGRAHTRTCALLRNQQRVIYP